jgi:hypothetical protein
MVDLLLCRQIPPSFINATTVQMTENEIFGNYTSILLLASRALFVKIKSITVLFLQYIYLNGWRISDPAGLVYSKTSSRWSNVSTHKNSSSMGDVRNSVLLARVRTVVRTVSRET